ncbi:MAG: hypothetical protein A2V65_02620 [Deltaproteobacteria bacterium RBG_13_49_15]|nr:MAG: hypothetical protein A2V65_02620 [Deltaproteobacteria bacterium RBG_13_49_15]
MDEPVISRLNAAIRRRKTLNTVTDAMRLVNSSGDGMPGLILERYGNHFSAQIFHPKWLRQKALLTAFIRDRLKGRFFIVKNRFRSGSADPDAFSTSFWIKEASSETTVRENTLRFSVDLNDGLNCGLFLDMRKNRSLVAEKAKGLNVLNCFAYTCSFGVYARNGGAARLVNVDISQKALERGRINYSLNGIEPAEYEFIRADAMNYMERAARKGDRFDLIILDPPSFARYRNRVFSVKKDLAHLVDRALCALKHEGMLFVSSNFSSLTRKDLLTAVRFAAGKRAFKTIGRLGQDIDFPGSGRMPESHLAALLIEL